MNWIVMTVAVAMLGACSPRDAVEGATDVGLDTVSVVQRVNDIYTQVFDYYGNVLTTSTLSSLDNIDSLYCSADWNAWVARLDNDVEQNGVMGFFDADYWIMGQDWGDLSVSDMRVTQMTATTATVELNLHNLGNVTPVRLEMVLEDGTWKIDNFIDVKNDFDWKAGMEEYLAGENANQ